MPILSSTCRQTRAPVQAMRGAGKGRHGGVRLSPSAGTSSTTTTLRLPQLPSIAALVGTLSLALATLVVPAAGQQGGVAVEAGKTSREVVWLVTQDGQRIAANGTWEQRGPRLLYRNLAGDLVSIRASEIDFEASARLNDPPPAPPAATEPREAVLVLDSNQQPELAAQPQAAPPADDPDSEAGAEGSDISAVATGEDAGGPAPESDPSSSAGIDGSASSPGASASTTRPRGGRAAEPRRATPTAVSSTVEVTSWRNLSPGQPSATIYGTLENTGQRNAHGIAVTVVVTDEAGGEILRQAANPLSSRLGPGETTNFRAILDDLRSYAEVSFEVTTAGSDSSR